MSYTSVDMTFNKERYIHVAAVDMVTTLEPETCVVEECKEPVTLTLEIRKTYEVELIWYIEQANHIGIRHNRTSEIEGKMLFEFNQ